jgi:c-di-GMP-binding flagellar brake protein YcgR
MATKKDTLDTGWRSLLKKDQPHSGVEGEAPTALLAEGATLAPAIDRRESPRFSIHLPVTLRHNGKLIPATTENMSCGGMSLSTAVSQLTIGGNVEVVVDLTEIERDVTLRGTVVRLDPQDHKKMGIQFVNLLSGGHTQLQRFLKKIQK